MPTILNIKFKDEVAGKEGEQDKAEINIILSYANRFNMAF